LTPKLPAGSSKAWFRGSGNKDDGVSPIEEASVRVGEANIRIGRSGSEAAIAVTGRITVDSSPRMRSMLLRLIPKCSGLFVVDLSGVTHIDMSGVATLLELLHYAHEHSVRLRLTGMSGQPRRISEVAQLDEIFRALGSEVEFH
jgi:anti-sigma B factor antagonist